MLPYKRRPKKALCGHLRRGAGCEGLSLLVLAARVGMDVGWQRDVELRQQYTGMKVQSAMNEARLEMRRRLQIPKKAGFHTLSHCEKTLTQFLRGLEDMALQEQSPASGTQQVLPIPHSGLLVCMISCNQGLTVQTTGLQVFFCLCQLKKGHMRLIPCLHPLMCPCLCSLHACEHWGFVACALLYNYIS